MGSIIRRTRPASDVEAHLRMQQPPRSLRARFGLRKLLKRA